MLSSLGVIIIQLSFKRISASAFLGISNEVNDELITTGIYNYVRHPIYSGAILIYLGAFLFTPTDTLLASLFWLIAYLPVGLYLEEKKLVSQYQQHYLHYKKSVKAIIPYVI
ncbi:MAG: isoprenylcysteine carboxylmethyltransferase family protein [Bacteroidota bacterium]